MAAKRPSKTQPRRSDPGVTTLLIVRAGHAGVMDAPSSPTAQAGWAVNLTPNARATFMTVSKRGFAPGARAL